MLDKPIPAKIILSLANSNSSGEHFIGLPLTLYHQNLICSRPREIRKKNNTLEIIVIFQDTCSFENWTKNEAIVTHWADYFNHQLTTEPQTVEERDVIIELVEVFNCSCNQTEFYILQGRTLPFVNELICNSCQGIIPFSKIPLNIKIEQWQTHHQRVYLNWLDSAFFEKQAYKELTNYKKGKLNSEGEKIRKQLSDYFQCPVYINYFVYAADDDDLCPMCNDQGLQSRLEIPGKICKKCNTAFG